MATVKQQQRKAAKRVREHENALAGQLALLGYVRVPAPGLVIAHREWPAGTRLTLNVRNGEGFEAVLNRIAKFEAALSCVDADVPPPAKPRIKVAGARPPRHPGPPGLRAIVYTFHAPARAR